MGKRKIGKQKCYYRTKRGACLKKAEIMDDIKYVEKTNLRTQVSIGFVKKSLVISAMLRSVS